MPTWTRATHWCLCGCCGRIIERGEPILEFTLSGIQQLKIRCASTACAGERPPADLEPLHDRQVHPPLSLTRFTPDMLPLDFKHKASGE